MQNVRTRALVAILVATLGWSCGKKTTPGRSAVEALDLALSPTAMSDDMRRLGGAHFHATASFQVTARKADPGDGSQPASPSTVVTTTDLWVDKQGNFRLVETNDQDGGREIVRVGGDVGVALRYGKMVRRPAQNAENARFLAEALGSPWAAWEVIRRQVDVQGESSGPVRFQLSKRKTDWPAHLPSPEGLRKWRGTLEVTSLSGQAQLEQGKTVRAFSCKAAFMASRDELRVVGTVDVTASLDQAGQVPAIEMPSSEPLQARQRTVLEERALLQGLGSAVPGPSKKTGP